MLRKEFLEILQAGEEGIALPEHDLLFLLSCQKEAESEAIYEAANRVRQRYVGDEVHLRGIIEFSNFCIQNCLYCGLRKDNRAIPRYRMTLEEILETAKMVGSEGFRTVVLQSGEDPWFTRERVSFLIQRIKEHTGLTVTLSLGGRPYADYMAWRKAGADRYLLKYETSSPALFRRLRPGTELTDRLRALTWLRELGYEVGSGNMVGLPGQSDEDLVRDILVFRQYDFDMIGIGPFIVHPQTPLGSEENGRLERTLKVLAITRIVTRDANLPATTAAGVLDPDGRRQAMLAGANVIMPDVTPPRDRQHYQIYPGKATAATNHQSLVEMISSLGRRIGRGSGVRIRSRYI